ncbi:hypothetical protein CLIB1423_10S03444 [[Candida] railenensis]|uniref:Zn(2)-C6 fungal-type domain-containing protein n=1 Tax=[Candida] railenensis TaxID=45579 RepID=A0A9P0QR16_9ASCO|nr:hypothetical protein CLIB1423_10S03444 [[Candida] railenensis]
MTEVFPISCLACRRLKVKCNRIKPCNQCTRRNLVCEFPSTYRNAAIYTERTNESYPINTHQDNSRRYSDDPNTGESPDDMLDELLSLRSLHSKVLDENARLRKRNKELNELASKSKPKTESDDKRKVTGKGSGNGSGNADGQGEPSGISISGETSELGEKYYGPQSSTYMIEELKSSESLKLNDDGALVGNEIKDTNEKVADIIRRNKNSNTPTDEKSQHQKLKSLAAAGISAKNAELIEKSLSKKDLPKLIGSSPEKNHQVTLDLVNIFFEQNTHYRSFISKAKIIDFLTDYKDIKDNEWERDDDLLLLYMVLLLSVQRLSPNQYQELGLLDGRKLNQFNKSRSHLSKSVLYFHFERLRHNLINESILTIQSYILCTEWYLIEQRYEESWSMMFHTCSIAYAIGLHAMKKVSFGIIGNQIRQGPNSTIENNQGKVTTSVSTTESTVIMAKSSAANSLTNPDVQSEDIDRFKVWFALKNICGQICSILGRPNPISIQVNSTVVKGISDTVLSDEDISERISHVLLKIGLSECLRLSNMMLIENFMLDFRMEDLITLNNKFDVEIRLLEWYLSSPSIDEKAKSDDEFEFEFPRQGDRANVVTDLIILYINRAKLFEPFVNKFTNLSEAKIISNMLRYSILNFLDYILIFITNFRNNFTILIQESKANFANNDLKLGKLFRLFYPFLNSFVYQGIIVIFTFLHYNFKDFINNFDMKADPLLVGETVNYNEFLYAVEKKLSDLVSFGQGEEKVKLWSSNTVKLVSKILEHIKIIFEKQALKAERDREMFEKELNEFHDVISNTDFQGYFGFNINDPFWLRNPDNFPYYLSSPSDDASSSDTQSSTQTQAQIKTEPEANQNYLKIPVPQQPSNTRQRLARNKSSTLTSESNEGEAGAFSMGTPSEGVPSSLASSSGVSNMNPPQTYYNDTDISTPQLTEDAKSQHRGSTSLIPMYDDIHRDVDQRSFPTSQPSLQGQHFSYSPMMVNGTQPLIDMNATPSPQTTHQQVPLTNLPQYQNQHQHQHQHPHHHHHHHHPQQLQHQQQQQELQQNQPQHFPRNNHNQHLPQTFAQHQMGLSQFSDTNDPQIFSPDQYLQQQYFQQGSGQFLDQKGDVTNTDQSHNSDNKETNLKRRRGT